MIDNNKLNEMVEDYAQILNRVTAAIPKTLTVRRVDEVDAKIETIELTATDYKDIATTLYIQLQRDKERQKPASITQLNWIRDLERRNGLIGEKYIDAYLDKLTKKNPIQLTNEEASLLIDELKAL